MTNHDSSQLPITDDGVSPIPVPLRAERFLTIAEYAQYCTRPWGSKSSRWTNPTKYVVRADVCVGPTGIPGATKVRIVWQPAETVELPSEFDIAIKHPTLVGCGLAPQLHREGDPLPKAPVVHTRATSRLVD